MTAEELLIATSLKCDELSKKANKICKECGTWDVGYSVKREVWAEVQPSEHSGFVCLSCLEILLNRPLSIEDFVPYPINYLLFFGYLMGKNDREKEK